MHALGLPYYVRMMTIMIFCYLGPMLGSFSMATAIVLSSLKLFCTNLALGLVSFGNDICLVILCVCVMLVLVVHNSLVNSVQTCGQHHPIPRSLYANYSSLCSYLLYSKPNL